MPMKKLVKKQKGNKPKKRKGKMPKCKNPKKIRYNFFQEQISKYSKDIDIPRNLNNRISIDMHNDLKSSIAHYENKIIGKSFELKKDMLKNEAIKTERYQLLPTNEQAIVFQKWFDAYIEMYNLVMKKIKTAFSDEMIANKKIKLINLEIDLNITKLKKELSVGKSNIGNKYNINLHILDYAMTDAIAMYKSKISNLKNGHIKKTRLRYLKKTKETKIFKVENHLCRSSTFCSSQLGSQILSCPPINFKKEIELVGIVQYNSKLNRYYLLVRKRIINNPATFVTNVDDKMELQNSKILASKTTTLSFLEYARDDPFLSKKIDLPNRQDKYRSIHDKIVATSQNYLSYLDEVKDDRILNRKIDVANRRIKNNSIYKNELNYRNCKTNNVNDISIDPGLRTFITGMSNNHTVEIGTNFQDQVKKKLVRIDNLTKNKSISKERLDKLVIRTRLNLKNKVNDYHWKIANHLTNNYKHILIGNFSTKEMGEGDQHKMIKRIGQSMRFYTFKQRLQYKCYLSGTKYKEVDEYCTSKCCSSCGNFKKDLGSNKTYICTKCGLVIDRDMNAAKNIYVKSIIK
jgi:IS605 OrfB family transposase